VRGVCFAMCKKSISLFEWIALDRRQTRGTMAALIWLIDTLFTAYWWVILLSVVLSWLVAFNIVNFSNPYVRQVAQVLRRLTEPVLGPVRRLLPDLGGIDISPIIVLIAMEFLRRLIIGQMVQLL
jgi:YggT family protein